MQTEIELWQQADDVQTCHISFPSGSVQIDASSFDTKCVLRRHFKTPKIVLPTSFLCFIRRTVLLQVKWGRSNTAFYVLQVCNGGRPALLNRHMLDFNPLPCILLQ